MVSQKCSRGTVPEEGGGGGGRNLPPKTSGHVKNHKAARCLGGNVERECVLASHPFHTSCVVTGILGISLYHKRILPRFPHPGLAQLATKRGVLECGWRARRDCRLRLRWTMVKCRDSAIYVHCVKHSILL
jgi:hypothetical protein